VSLFVINNTQYFVYLIPMFYILYIAVYFGTDRVPQPGKVISVFFGTEHVPQPGKVFSSLQTFLDTPDSCVSHKLGR
jgi:hypothetical protein